MCYSWKGEFDQALAKATELLALSGRNPWVLAIFGWSLCKAGKSQWARAVYDELSARARHEFVSPFWLAVAATSAGCQDEAMKLAERAVAERDSFVVVGRFMPFWEGVRADVRFTQITKGVWNFSN
jgi:predicted Zn-dependent protease